MYIVDALYGLPKNKKAFLLEGDASLRRILLKNKFPTAYEVTTVGELFLDNSDTVIVSSTIAPEHVRDVLKSPASGKIYLFVTDERDDDLRDLIKESRQTVIECEDPHTPSQRGSTTRMIMDRCSLFESQAVRVGVRAEWKLTSILGFIMLWKHIVGSSKLSDSQFDSLLDLYLPVDPTQAFVENFLKKNFLKLDFDALSSETVLFKLSNVMNKVRILKSVIGTGPTDKNLGHVLSRTGLTKNEIDAYKPFTRSWTNAQLSTFVDSMVWVWGRRDKPGALQAFVNLVRE